MLKRIVLAGLLGGLALFVWEFVAHELLPLGEAGLKALPNEPATLAAMKANVAEPGLYIFPAPDAQLMAGGQKQQAMDAMQNKIREGPVGIMVVHPNGVAFSFVVNLVTQFGLDVITMLLAAILLAKLPASSGYGGRVLFVALLGLFPTLRTELPYWNWYGFPGTYVAAQLTLHVVGLLLGGLILAKLVSGAAK